MCIIQKRILGVKIMSKNIILKPWSLIAELTDKNVLGLEGMSNHLSYIRCPVGE